MVQLQQSKFDDLPINFKRGLMTWMYEGVPVEWSIDEPIINWANDKNVDILINDYSKEKGKLIFSYGFVSTESVINKIIEWIDSEGDYNSFEDWHTTYQSTNDANHGNSIFPIIVDDNDEEYIVDGWHRFSFYLTRGYNKIPIIKIS